MSVAYKEVMGEKYWMNLLKETGFLEEKGYEDLFQDVDEIAGMLFSVFKPSGRVRVVNWEL